MSKIKLDLTNWKHVSSNDKTTKLRHKDGHFLVMAKSALSKDSQAQLKALSNVGKENQTADQANEIQDNKMAEGGEAEVKQNPDYNIANTNVAQDVYNAITDAPRIANDMYHAVRHEPQTGPQPKAEGGKVDTPPRPPDPVRAKQMAAGAKSNEMDRMAQGVQNAKNEFKGLFGYAEGTPDAPVGDVEDLRAKDPAFSQPMQAPAEEGPPGYDNSVMPAEEPILDQYAKRGKSLQREMARMPASAEQVQQPQVPDEAAQTQKIYNSIVSGNPNNSSTQVNTRPWAVFGPNGEPPKSFDAAAWSQAEQQTQKEQVDSSSANQAKAQQIQQDNIIRQRAGLPPIPVPGINTPDGVPADEAKPVTEPQQDSVQPQSQAEPDALSSGMQNTQDMMQQGVQQRMAGIQQQSEAQQLLAQGQQEALKQNQEAQQNAQIAFKQHYDELDAERKNHIADIKNGYIDPNQYWTGDKNGNGGHSKIAAGIGMILAGFNPTNSPNAAVNFLKFQMEQNLASQQHNLSAKQNLLAANLRQFGNLRDAQDMTRLMQNDLVQNELQQAAATAATPAAKAAALNASGQLEMEAAPMMQQFAMRRAFMNMASNGNSDPQSVEHMIAYARVMNPEMAKEMESRYVPGVGLSNVPVPDGVRKQIVAHKDVNQAMNQVLDFAKQHSGSLSLSTRAQGQALINQLQSKIRVAEDQGVYKESEANFMRQTIGSSPASFLAGVTTVPKVKELQQLKQQDYNNLLQTYGFKPQQLPQAQQGPVVGKDGKQYVKQIINGKAYMVPAGK